MDVAFIAMLFLTSFTGIALVRYARERRMLEPVIPGRA
jgi:hypothetical protein